MTKPKEQSAALVTIFRAPLMSPRGRRNIAKWLRWQAELWETQGKSMSPIRYTGRYLYRDELRIKRQEKADV